MKSLIAFVLALNLCVFLSAQNSIAARISPSNEGVPANTVLADAYNAYQDGDYQSAVFLFRKALGDRQNQSDGALYMLIMAGMHSGEYKAAYADTEYFLASYPNSPYAPLVKYQQGRALFYMEDYDKALMVLGDFCHENPDNMMYSSALFWIGECFYAGYNFDKALPFYERIVTEFPKDAKASDAKYRLDAINSHKREEKLLYMLRQTGENYLSSKENYEKVLRQYEMENSFGANRKQSSNSSGVSAVYDDEVKLFDADEGLSVQDETSKEDVSLTQESGADNASLEDKAENDNFEIMLLRLKMSAMEAQNLLNEEVRK